MWRLRGIGFDTSMPAAHLATTGHRINILPTRRTRLFRSPTRVHHAKSPIRSVWYASIDVDNCAIVTGTNGYVATGPIRADKFAEVTSPNQTFANPVNGHFLPAQVVYSRAKLGENKCWNLAVSARQLCRRKAKVFMDANLFVCQL